LAVFKTAAFNHSATTPGAHKLLQYNKMDKLAEVLSLTNWVRGNTPMHELQAGDRAPTVGYVRAAGSCRTRAPGLRLQAILSAIVSVAACGGCDGGSATGAWQFNVDTTRSQTEGSVRQTAWLRAVGKEGSEGAAQADAVILSFDCFPGTTSSTIMTDQALRQGSVETRLKVDADPPRRIPGFAGTTASGGQVVLTIPQDSMLALLSGHQRVTIEYADGAGSSRTTAVFPVAGVEKYREPFLAACAKRGSDDRE
jgi:hypothetical protein